MQYMYICDINYLVIIAKHLLYKLNVKHDVTFTFITLCNNLLQSSENTIVFGLFKRYAFAAAFSFSIAHRLSATPASCIPSDNPVKQKLL